MSIELGQAIEGIRDRITVVVLTSEIAEFLTKNGWYVEIMRTSTGCHIRTYNRRSGGFREADASGVIESLDVARRLCQPARS